MKTIPYVPFFCSPYVEEKIPSHILTVHVAVSCLALLLTVVTTAGYVSACNNLHSGVRNQVREQTFNPCMGDHAGLRPGLG